MLCIVVSTLEKMLAKTMVNEKQKEKNIVHVNYDHYSMCLKDSLFKLF